MRYFLTAAFFLLWQGLCFAQISEGVYTIHLSSEREKTITTEVKIKGHLAIIKQTKNGNPKYTSLIIDLKSRELFTVSTPDKKVVVKYHLDSLTAFYERNEIKEGYRANPAADYKSSEKTKEENGIKMQRYIGETTTRKLEIWQGDGHTSFVQLLPLLRLIGSWNEAQNGPNMIWEAVVNNKTSKKETRVVVRYTQQNIQTEAFELPKDYLQKDFSALMKENCRNPQLVTAIQAFTGF